MAKHAHPITLAMQAMDKFVEKHRDNVKDRTLLDVLVGEVTAWTISKILV